MGKTGRTAPLWLLYSLLALALWTLWGLVGAALGRQLSPFVVQVIATAGLLLAAALLVMSPRARKHTNLRRGIALAFAAGLSANAGNVLLLWALNLSGPVSLVMPLTAMYPLVTAVLARLFLRERLGRVQQLGFVLAIAAGVIVGRLTAVPAAAAGAGAAAWVPAACGALLCFGTTGFLQKLATKHVSSELCTMVFAIAAVPIASGILLFGPELSFVLPARSWMLSIGFGVLLAAGTLAQFAAYRRGKASVVTGLTGLYPAVTVLLAVPLLGERLDAWRVGAVSLALLAGVALSQDRAVSPEEPSRG